MPLSDMRRTELLTRTREAASAFVGDVDHIRQVLANEGTSIDEIRRLSGVLRRLLVERELAEIATPRMGRILLRAPDNNPIYKAARKQPLLFFASVRVRVFGWDGGPMQAWDLKGPLTARDQTLKTFMPPDLDISRTVELRLDNFLAQHVLALRGEWASRKDVIKYVAHKASGVHSGTPTDAKEATLAHLRRSTHIRKKEDGNIHLALLDDGIDSQETAFKPLAPDSIDPVLIELLAAGHFLSISPDVISLEKIIKKELVAL